MKKVLLLFFVPLIALVIFLAAKFVSTLIPVGQGAIQVTANIKADVYLDEKLIGQTNLNKTLNVGNYSLKISPNDQSFSPFTIRIKIEKDVMTVVDRTFLPGSLASAYVLNLEKINNNESQFAIISLPDQAMVTIDGSPQGITPFLIKTISNSEHDIEIQKQGFNKKTLRVKTIPSYKLIANVILGTGTTGSISPTSTIEAEKQSSPSATIKILSTPNGFLRVRETPSLSAKEVARVNTGEKFSLIDEQNEWYKIKLNDQISGWISASFAEKIIEK